jgi:hypothetical protein
VRVLCADLQHQRVLAEYSDPLLRKGSHGQSDQLGQREGHQHTDPSRPYGSLDLTGAKVCAYHDSDRTADAAAKRTKRNSSREPAA